MEPTGDEPAGAPYGGDGHQTGPGGGAGDGAGGGAGDGGAAGAGDGGAAGAGDGAGSGADLPERLADLVGGVTEEQVRQTGDWRAMLVSGVSRTAETAARRVGRGVRAAGRRSRLGSRWLADQVLAAAPRLPIRDQETLRAHFPGKSPEQVADALIEGASRGTATVGAAVGAWSVFPVLPAFPVEVATETLAVVGIEIKLIAELHEVYGMRAPGATVDRMTAYVAAWAHRRGVSLTAAPAGLMVAAGSPLRRLLQRRLAARATRNAFSLGPLFTGAIAGAALNRHHTHRLGVDVRNDLRKHSPFAAHWPD